MSTEDAGLRWLAEQVAAVAPGAAVEIQRSPRGYYAVTIGGAVGVLRIDADWVLECLERAQPERVRRQVRLYLEEHDI